MTKREKLLAAIEEAEQKVALAQEELSIANYDYTSYLKSKECSTVEMVAYIIVDLGYPTFNIFDTWSNFDEHDAVHSVIHKDTGKIVLIGAVYDHDYTDIDGLSDSEMDECIDLVHKLLGEKRYKNY